MERIVVIGNGGSGKSTLARQLAAILDLPLTHLDAVYYDEDWRPLPHEDFVAEQQRLTAQGRWIIEGNYASTLPVRLAAADTAILLDLPAITCLWGIVQRRMRYRGGQHPRDGVYDRITWGFIRYVAGYRRSMRPRVRAAVAEHGSHARAITLASRREADDFLNRVSSDRRGARNA
ncbi:topology modulation protein [Catellatospora sp. KI3]|uniref:topology modulation protein n=1 Tax=Catellatospora sp. KI3 TaxID=3041620 RepID=UPI002482C791|nr:topology modulation protein [Catellatospora sp. KI3]MDI1460611.1 topology modulation protein [Catellatospora sp. KI3]